MLLKTIFDHYILWVKKFRKPGYFDFTKLNLEIIESYFNDINVIDSDQLTNQMIYDLMDYFRNERDNSNSTLKKKLNVLKRALKRSSVSVSFIDFKVGRIDHVPYKAFSDQELKIIVNYYSELNFKNKNNLTKYVLFLIFFHTAVRRTEICYIKISHINFDSCSIFLNVTKSGDKRYVYFREYMIKTLKEYISLKERDYLFWNFKYDRPLLPKDVSNMFKYDKRIMQLKDYSSHMYRHTFATRMLQNGATLLSVSKLLGHKSIETTRIYEHVNQDYVYDSFNRFSNKL
jgi:site-specific recombinase XerD